MKTDNQIFNPANLPKDLLIENFVVRTKVFERIFKDIKSGKMRFPEQHYIIQGTRGMGKTTLLLRLKYEIEKSPELDSWLMPVFFGEETYDVSSISNLWEKLLKYLDDAWQTGGSLYKQTTQFIGSDDYEKKCYQILKEALQGRKKKIVLFFDNFGELFLDYLSEEESHRLREILMNCNDIRIIAASAVVIKDLHDYGKPFFDFFKIIHLEGLSKEEALQLIVKMQEKDEKKIDIKKHKAKIETLAVLSGGVIRTIVLLYEVLLADEDGSALKYLDGILNWLTPLYKHRMEDLPVQQRKIVDVIAKQWDAISTKEIAEKIRENGKPLNSKLVSAQLTQLEKNNIVEKKATTTKNHLYQLKERFFNIWYLMRNGDSYDKKRVIWLTRFLEAWYDDNKSIGSFIDSHIAKLRKGIYDPNAALLIAEAVSNAKDLEIKKQHELIEETKKILPDELKKKLPASHVEKFFEAHAYFEKKEYTEALTILNAIPGSETLAMQGSCKIMLRQYAEGVDFWEKAFKAGKKSFAKFLATVYQYRLQNYKKAICFYLHDAKAGAYKSFLSAAKLYAYEIGNIELAEKYFNTAVKLNVNAAKKEAGDFYFNIKNDSHAAERLYQTALTEGDLGALIGLAQIESEKKEYEKAISLYEKAIGENIGLYDAHLGLGTIHYIMSEDLIAEKHLAKCLQFDENHHMAKLLLSQIYFDNHRNKESALKYTESLVLLQKIDNSSFLLNVIRIWNNKIEGAILFFDELKKDGAMKQNEEALQILSLLIAKNQYHLALQYFSDEEFNFKDKFKPLYYALMHYLKDEYPNEIIKMGKELEQPVNEIIANIEQMRVDYE